MGIGKLPPATRAASLWHIVEGLPPGELDPICTQVLSIALDGLADEAAGEWCVMAIERVFASDPEIVTEAVKDRDSTVIVRIADLGQSARSLNARRCCFDVLTGIIKLSEHTDTPLRNATAVSDAVFQSTKKALDDPKRLVRQ